MNKALPQITEVVEDKQCFDDALAAIHTLEHHLSNGWKDHVSSQELQFNIGMLQQSWLKEKEEVDCKMMSLKGIEVKLKLDEWAKRLDQLHPSSWAFRVKLTSRITYDNLLRKLKESIAMTFDKGEQALQTRDYTALQESIEIMDLMSAKVGHRIEVADVRARELKERTQNRFVS